MNELAERVDEFMKNMKDKYETEGGELFFQVVATADCVHLCFLARKYPEDEGYFGDEHIETIADMDQLKELLQDYLESDEEAWFAWKSGSDRL